MIDYYWNAWFVLFEQLKPDKNFNRYINTIKSTYEKTKHKPSSRLLGFFALLFLLTIGLALIVITLLIGVLLIPVSYLLWLILWLSLLCLLGATFWIIWIVGGSDNLELVWLWLVEGTADTFRVLTDYFNYLRKKFR